MEDNQSMRTENEPDTKNAGSSNRGKMVLVGVIAVVVLAAIIAAFVFLIRADPTTTGQVRDVFIIFMALESIVIGIALIILIIQLAILTNLIQNEVKPILDSTNETVNTMRGTVSFLADNLVDPVIRMNSYVAGLRRFMDLIRPDRW
jgi:heme/copper-type cytochrome/quinol oxidase subunit 2